MKKKIEKLNLEEYFGFIGEPIEYKAPNNYLFKSIEDKINEIIKKLNQYEKRE